MTAAHVGLFLAVIVVCLVAIWVDRPHPKPKPPPVPDDVFRDYDITAPIRHRNDS